MVQNIFVDLLWILDLPILQSAFFLSYWETDKYIYNYIYRRHDLGTTRLVIKAEKYCEFGGFFTLCLALSWSQGWF